jgi:hypothetical protein
MYASTNRCYNERGSRTIYVRSSIPHCIIVVCNFASAESTSYLNTTAETTALYLSWPWMLTVLQLMHNIQPVVPI